MLLTTLILTRILTLTVSLAWDPDAGLVKSYSKMAGVTVKATSNKDGAHLAVDGNDNTQWTSGKCLPSGYVSEADHNVLLRACSKGECTSTTHASSSSSLQVITDGNFYTNTAIKAANGGKATLTIKLPAPTKMAVLTLEGKFDAGVDVSVYSASSHHMITHLTSKDDYKTLRFNLTGEAVTDIVMSSASDFTVNEVAALSSQGCLERLVVDLGSLRDVATIRTRHWAGGNTLATRLLTSVDGQSWQVVRELNPDAVNGVTTSVDPSRRVQFIAVEHQLEYRDWVQCYVWEVDAWGVDRRWGSKPQPVVNAKTLWEMFGVNGIWGWGHRVSSTRLKSGEGAFLYDQVASHARNYHNMAWDIKTPQQNPNYGRMSQGHGTAALSWVNWDAEYDLWVKANLTVDASIQFDTKNFPENAWHNPRQEAMNYGLEFARHFGPSVGNHLIHAAEVGNEPWDYSGAFYEQLLEGMARGLKTGDPKMVVLPGAFQADEISSSYIGDKVKSPAAPFIDVINGHYYSFLYRPDGVRITTYPENPDSSFNGVRNLIRWRDVNTPGKPVWITEWGWDSPGAGQTCTFPECVSEDAAALYGLRGLMLLARYGVERATWFFYANLDHQECPVDKQHIFCRSGLTGSSEAGFAKKKVFYAFQHFFQIMGDKHFLSVIKEDDDAHVYLFGDIRRGGHQSPWGTHIVAWRPCDAGDKTRKTFVLDVPTTPLRSWRLTSEVNPPAVTSLNNHHGRNWPVEVSSEPLVVEISGMRPDHHHDIHPVG